MYVCNIIYIHLCLHIFQYLHIHIFVEFVFFPRASASFAFQVLVRQRVGLLQPCLGIHFWIQQEMGISRLNHQLKNPKMEIYMGIFSVSKLRLFWWISPSKKKGFLGTAHDWRWSIKHHGGFGCFHLKLSGKLGISWEDMGRIWWFKESEPLYGINYMDIL